MGILKYAPIQLQPNARVSEHINIGIIIYDADNEKVQIVAPDNFSNTKLKNWFPKISPTMISKYIYLMKQDADKDDIGIEEMLEIYCNGIVRIGSLTSARVVIDHETTIARIYDNTTDLRVIRPSGSLWSAGKIKSVLKNKLQRKELLNTKAEIDPEPIKFKPEEMPAFMNVRWLNGVNQYVRIFSVDKNDDAGEDSIRNSWDDAKAVIDDCELLLDHNFGASIILQRQESQVNGDLSEIAEILEYRLRSIGVKIYNLQELDVLVNRIGEGRNIYN